MNSALIIDQLQHHFPKLLAIYAFGSRIRGDSDSLSDLDLAILTEGYADPKALWDVSNTLANVLNVDIDLLDFRAASTVMQYQILMDGTRWWNKDSQAAFYEAAMLSEKIALDEAREGLINDIRMDGRVYAR